MSFLIFYDMKIFFIHDAVMIVYFCVSFKCRIHAATSLLRKLCHGLWRRVRAALAGSAGWFCVRVVASQRVALAGSGLLVLAIAAGSACWLWLSRREVLAGCGYRGWLCLAARYATLACSFPRMRAVVAQQPARKKKNATAGGWFAVA
ncbi:MAG: hypothetical protein Ta2A_21750 [Treponemataceae bacterium]|nr:MAG: hypothetical protein Ta2A_21750 [Treponemataceae bacterium]